MNIKSIIEDYIQIVQLCFIIVKMVIIPDLLSISFLSYKFAIFPFALVNLLSIFTVKSTIPILFSIEPITLIFFLGRVY